MTQHDEIDYSKYLVYLETNQTGIIKSIFDRLSTQFTECPVVFTPMEDGEGEPDENYYAELNRPAQNSTSQDKSKRKVGGIRIHQFKPTGDLLAVVQLYASAFTVFHCEERISVGIDVQQTHKAINNISDSDVLKIYIMASNPTVIYFASTNNDADDKSCDSKIVTITLSHPNHENIPLKRAAPERRLTMDTAELRRVCRAISDISPTIEITSAEKEVTFKSANDIATYQVRYSDLSKDAKENHTEEIRNEKPRKKGNATDIEERHTEKIVGGQYNVKILIDFSKCENLCRKIDINMRNDFPLILVIKCGSLGKMFIIIAPINTAGNR